MSWDELLLPRGYTENQPEAIDAEDGPGYWAHAVETRARNARRYQDPVYRFAARLTTPPVDVVLDIGCGSGQNLMRHLGGRVPRTVGVDQSSAIALARADFPDGEWIAGDLRSDDLWGALQALRPDLSICADVIEHVDDPLGLLTRLRGLVRGTGRLVLSTPDRDRLEDQPPLGPPKNAHHIREWTFAEMTRLLESTGFVIKSSRHVLPRHYAFTKLDTKIIAWRALHLRAVPARRSCMVFELSRA